MATFQGDARFSGDAVAGDKIVHGFPAPVFKPPRQLPLDVADFTGRAGSLATLNEHADGRGRAYVTPVIVVTGMPGVGKTALAVHWAHSVAQRFPDGHLFLDLRGFSARGALPATDALGQALRALGVPGHRIPTDQDEMAALYRSQLATRSMLIVLDDAANSEQIRPLLPAGSSCVVVITSRNVLGGLVARHRARTVSLDVFTDTEAQDLVRVVAGRARTDAEPGAVAELVQLCARLPLAVSVAAANLAIRPQQSVSEVVRVLCDEEWRRSLSLDGDLGEIVWATFDLSYQGLTDDLRRAFRLIGLVDCPILTPEATGALLRTTVAAARRTLNGLAGANLVQAVADDRYQLHDLLKEYARGRAREEEAPLDQAAAIQRLGTWYLAAAQDARRFLDRYRRTVRQEPGTPPGGSDPAERARRLGWFERERTNITALIRQVADLDLHQLTWELADALYDYLELRRYSSNSIIVHQLGLQAAERDERKLVQFFMRHHIAVSLGQLGRYKKAIAEGQAALEISRQIHDQYGEAVALNQIAQIQYYRGEYRSALAGAERALEIRQDLGDRHTEAETLDTLAQIHEGLSNYQEALERAQEALVLHSALDDLRGEAQTMVNLARIHLGMGRDGEALGYAARALKIRQRVEDRHGEGEAVALLGSLYTRLGRHQEAHDHIERALAFRRLTGDRRGEAEALVLLSRIHRRNNRYTEAVHSGLVALDMFQHLGIRAGEAEALETVARAYRRMNAYEMAFSAAGQAIKISGVIGDKYRLASALETMARTHRTLGKLAIALSEVRESLKIRREIGDRRGEGFGLYTLSRIQRDRGDNEEALRIAAEALLIEEEVEDHYSRGVTLAHMGIVCVRLNRPDEALTYLERAATVQHTIGQRLGEVSTLRLMAEILNGLGREKEAQDCLNAAQRREEGT